MKAHLYCLLLLLLSVHSMAQHANHQEFVRANLPDGSTYIGEKLSEEADIVQIRIYSGDIIFIDKRYAKKYYDNQNAIVYEDGKYYKTKGFLFEFNLAFNGRIFSDADEDEMVGRSLHVEYLFGHRFNDKIELSMGFGTEFNEAEVGGFNFATQFTSIFAHGQYYFLNSRPRPFVFGRIGYGSSAEENQEEQDAVQNGGTNFQYGIGIQFPSRKKSKFKLSLAHYIQPAKGTEFFFDPIGNEIETAFDIKIQRILLKLGWQF